LLPDSDRHLKADGHFHVHPALCWHDTTKNITLARQIRKRKISNPSTRRGAPLFMPPSQLNGTIENILAAIAGLVPEYRKNPVDQAKGAGHCAACIIEADGTIHGKMFGDDKNRLRNLYRVAWMKASQAWITGMKTGEYEKKVFNSEVNADLYGIILPDLIGWEGGQPITLKDGKTIFAGFSGFTSKSDLEIVLKAVAMVER
jgi:glc operon protein GlcG